MSRRGGGSGPSALPDLYAIYHCEVVSIQQYGVFVKIPGFFKNGLVHKSQMSSTRVDDPSEVVEKGERVYCKVISVDPDTEKIGMSMKVVSQTSGKDQDPGHVQAALDEKRRKTGFQRETPRIELGAVLDTTCRKCGARGHLSQDCFHTPGTRKYDLVPDSENLPKEEDEAKNQSHKLSKKQKKEKKRAEKEKKKKKKKKKNKKRKHHDSDSNSDSEDEPTPKKKKKKNKKNKKKVASSSSSSSDSDSDSAPEAERRQKRLSNDDRFHNPRPSMAEGQDRGWQQQESMGRGRQRSRSDDHREDIRAGFNKGSRETSFKSTGDNRRGSYNQGHKRSHSGEHADPEERPHMRRDNKRTTSEGDRYHHTDRSMSGASSGRKVSFGAEGEGRKYDYRGSPDRNYSGPRGGDTKEKERRDSGEKPKGRESMYEEKRTVYREHDPRIQDKYQTSREERHTDKADIGKGGKDALFARDIREVRKHDDSGEDSSSVESNDDWKGGQSSSRPKVKDIKTYERSKDMGMGSRYHDESPPRKARVMDRSPGYKDPKPRHHNESPPRKARAIDRSPGYKDPKPRYHNESPPRKARDMDQSPGYKDKKPRYHNESPGYEDHKLSSSKRHSRENDSKKGHGRDIDTSPNNEDIRREKEAKRGRIIDSNYHKSPGESSPKRKRSLQDESSPGLTHRTKSRSPDHYNSTFKHQNEASGHTWERKESSKKYYETKSKWD